jgi:hypothetical protein
MNKVVAFLLIILISFSFEARMRCFDDLDGAPTEKCYVADMFNGLQYYDSCKNGKVCTLARRIVNFNIPGSLDFISGETANYGVCAPLPYGGYEGAVCGDNAECFSNNCDGTSCGAPKEYCKMHSECEKGKYCNISTVSYHTDTTPKTIQPTNKCDDLRKKDGDCIEDYQCPPFYLCHRYEARIKDSIAYGKCKKIGSIDNEFVGYGYSMLCKSGFEYRGYCVKESTINCVTKSGGLKFYKTGIDVSLDNGLILDDIRDDLCRNSLFDGSPIPKVNDKSISAFKKYLDEVNEIDMDPEKKHANFGTTRYHYDKKKVKEALVKAMYYELDNEDDDQAECLLDVVKQIVLSGEKINFSKILVLAFALLLI